MIAEQAWVAQRRMLTEQDREEISRGIVAGLAGQLIAARIRRCPSVVSREVRRQGGRAGYRAVAAQRVATQRRCQPKIRKIDADPELAERVVDTLRAGCSPEQVAGRLRDEHPGQKACQVSHEAIYTWIYALPKGELAATGSCCVPGAPSAVPAGAGPARSADHRDALHR